MESLERLIQEKKSQLRIQLSPKDTRENMSGWMDTLIYSMEILPDILRINLSHLKPVYTSEKMEYPVFKDGNDEKKNTDAMSLLYSYVTNFLQKGVFPNIVRGNRFKPSDLGKGVNLLSQIKQAVHTIYSSYVSMTGRRDDLTTTKAVYPIDSSASAIARFLAEYKAVEQMRYISAYKQVLDSLGADSFELISNKERIAREFAFDPEFVRAYVIDYVGKNWGELTSMAKSWDALAKTHMSSFCENFKLSR